MSEQRSIADLITDCHNAMGKMGVQNSHRAVIQQCVAALTELSLRLHQAERPRPVVFETPDPEPLESHGEAV